MTLEVIAGGGQGTPPATTRHKRWCHHERFELDPDSRRVYCADCEEEVDAFSALETFAHTWDRYATGLRQLKEQCTEASVTLQDLKRQIRNAKAQRRRA